jgi:Ni2+-binding GTPase involved in maturation of urease and hydrogenase
MVIERLLSIGPLGLAGIASGVAAVVLAVKSGNGYPQDPASVIHNYKTIWAGKIAFTILSIGISMVYVPWMPIINLIAGFLALLGPLYFPTQFVLDVITYGILHGKEWCTHDRYIAANFLNIPFASLLVAYSAYSSSRKLAKRYREAVGEASGIRLGWIEMAVRRVSMITYPQTYMGSELKMYSEKWEVRRTPGQKPYIYSPEKRSNPHICITGTSGVGKTTAAIYILAEALRRKYRIIVLDPKGDISETARARKWHVEKDGERVMIIDVAKEGIEPLEPILDESMTESLIDLINSMSVVETVGANQKSLILYMGEKCEKAGKKRFRDLYDEVSSYVESIIQGGNIKLGPHVKDAYMGIQSKMKILLTVFGREEPVKLSLLDPSNWGDSVMGVILDLSKIRDRYARAVTMELLLRKIEAFLRKRGPLAYLEKGFKHTFILVDEVHEIARGQRWGQEMTVSILEDMAREARSHGAALILVTQRLSDIPDGIRSNIGLWLTLRSDSPHDMEVLYRVVPVGRLSEIVTSMPDGYALIVEADPSRLSRMKAVTSKPSAYDEAYVIKLERIMMEYRKSVEEAQRQAGAVEKPAPTEATMLQGAATSVSRDRGVNRPLTVVHVEAGAKTQDENRNHELFKDILGRVGSIDGVRERVANIPLTVMEAFINDVRRNEWKKALPRECWSMPEEYLKHWLIEEYRGKLRATPIGRALIDSAKTVFTLRGDEDE